MFTMSKNECYFKYEYYKMCNTFREILNKIIKKVRIYTYIR